MKILQAEAQPPMVRTIVRLAGPLALSGALLLTPAASVVVRAADPTGSPAVSEPAGDAPSEGVPSPSASDGGISIDPTFITSPTATPSGTVLSATGRPHQTLPATDAASGPATAAEPQGVPLLLFLLAITSLVAARLPEVRRG